MQNLETVKTILKKHYDLNTNPTFIFGSRANGTNREDSDLDILIEDKDITPSIMTSLHEDFEQSNILYKVDIILKSRIDSEFFNNIKNDLKPLYD